MSPSTSVSSIPQYLSPLSLSIYLSAVPSLPRLSLSLWTLVVSEQSETEQASTRTHRAQRGVESVILHRVARRTISSARKRVVGDATFEAQRVAVPSARDRECHTHARLASGLQLHPCVAARSSRCCIPRALMRSLRQYDVDAVHSPAARRQTRVVDAMQRQKTTTRLTL